MDDIACLTHQLGKLRPSKRGGMCGFNVFHMLIFIIRVNLGAFNIHRFTYGASNLDNMSANNHQNDEV